ncbi:MAG: response regulator [Verrucomicrobiota bacterium]
MRIFIVENHPDTLKWIRLHLEISGHTIQTAGTVAETLKLFPRSNSEVLLSDIGLPDGTGWELIEQLRASNTFLAIAMSGFGLKADTTRSRAAGFHHHLIKPFKPAELDWVLDKVVRERESSPSSD